jgi:glycosyltransferase involved in cell wall biosynthesis
MSIADVLVVITSEAEAGAATMTGKLFEYLAIGRPILYIAPPGPGADLVRETGAGVIAQPDDPDAIGRALLEVSALAHGQGFRDAPGGVLRQFDRRVLAEAWAELFHTVIRTSPAA